MTKSKFLYKTINTDGDVEWWYEYRGYEYSIVPFKTEESLYQLHKNEKLDIDRRINYTLNRLTRSENVNTDTLVKVCRALNCQIDDIVEIV